MSDRNDNQTGDDGVTVAATTATTDRPVTSPAPASPHAGIGTGSNAGQGRPRRTPDPRFDKTLRGAPSMPTWRNPTIWLAALTVTLWGAGTIGYLTGAVAWWATIPLNALATYLAFSVLHESVHRVAHKNRTLNDWLGRLGGAPLCISQPAFRVIHTMHHSHTNDPDDDPDINVARGPWMLRPLFLLAPLWDYHRMYYGRSWWKNRAELAEQVGLDAVVIGIVLAATAAGYGTAVAVCWIIPTLLAVMLLTFAFDLLPHKPYDSTERFHDTRALPSRLLNIVLLGQNYHLIHHAWVTVPWYNYRHVYDQTVDELAARGARVYWGD